MGDGLSYVVDTSEAQMHVIHSWAGAPQVVSPVGNQGITCGCHGFSSVDAARGALFLKTCENVPQLSPREVINNCFGGVCKGHHVYCAFEWIMQNGVAPEAFMPFDENEISTRGLAENCPRYWIDEWEPLRDNENSIENALSTQTVTIALTCPYSFFSSYKGGLINAYLMSHDKGDPYPHAVLLVGYGYFKFPDGKKINFWHAKSSCGTSFGDNGYFYLIRNSSLPPDEHVLLSPTIPIVFGPGEKEKYDQRITARFMSLDDLAHFERNMDLDIIILFYDNRHGESHLALHAFDRVSRFYMHQRDVIFAKIDVDGDWNQLDKYGILGQNGSEFVIRIYKHGPARPSEKSMRRLRTGGFIINSPSLTFYQIAELVLERAGGSTE